MSQTTGYAISALGCLAGIEGRTRLVRDVADCAGLALPYLSKIILTLSRKGVVATRKGIGGGVRLACDPHSVSLYEVCVLMDDPVIQMRCLMGTAPCSAQRNCPCHEFWAKHRERLFEFLMRTTLADIARFEAKRCSTARLQAKDNASEGLVQSLMATAGPVIPAERSRRPRR
ncbi:MAG: Rrf2 family transcriptional regulator [Armatimonadetes bacterium]|nr:Rrf2 family transcriptional regulator [Armatimonadota bacterium]